MINTIAELTRALDSLDEQNPNFLIALFQVLGTVSNVNVVNQFTEYHFNRGWLGKSGTRAATVSRIMISAK